MLKICLVFGASEPQYAYKRYAYKKRVILQQRNTKSLIFERNFKQKISEKKLEKLVIQKNSKKNF